MKMIGGGRVNEGYRLILPLNGERVEYEPKPLATL